ncbi:MAG: hypothetical protein JHD16_01345 [Solirubrobacteraceae bacterium]|nr:hypothetical protein [Solirubrobacteraceae bacterium]
MGIDYNKRPSKPTPPADAGGSAPPAGKVDTSKPAPASAPVDTSKQAAPAAAPPAAGPISLTKRGQSVSLTKGGTGPVRINLNWNQAAPAASGGGLFKKLTQGSGQIDLDLGCLFELADGRKGVVQALGNSFGALDQPPFIKLDKDDRSGAATDGENLFISAEHSAQIKRIAVFAFIYEGAPNWSKAGGIVTIHPPAGPPVTIALDETRDGVGMCAVCLISGGPAGYTVERQVEYVSGHKQLDERFGWGMNWVRGSK